MSTANAAVRLAVLLAPVIGCGRGPAPSTHTAAVPNSTATATTRDTVPDSDSPDTTVLDPHADVEGSGAFIDSMFNAKLGELPRMGWALPDTFLASERHPALYIWATGQQVRQAKFIGPVSSKEHERIAKDTHLACDAGGPLAAYGLQKDDTVGERAFYTSKAPPAGTSAGVTFHPLTPQEIVAAHQLIAGNEPGVQFRDTAVAAPRSGYFYTIDAVYDTSGAALRDALVLFDSLGHVVGSKVEADTGETCDGCGPITFGEGYSRLYDVLNAFVIPGFPYPVLFLDTSTVEGRALSLVTFDSKGRYGSYRVYEYVVSCILGDSQ